MEVTTRVQELADALAAARPTLDPDQQRIARHVYRLLARGRPATAAEIAAAAKVPLPAVEDALASWPGVFRDGAGAVVGFWGLTVAEMPPHQVEAEGVRLWAWCAWDTLFLPERLGTTLQVRSVDPVSNTPIELRVAPDRVESVEPAGVVVSFLRPDKPFEGDVIESFCHFVHFFSSEAQGQVWVGEHPGTFLLSLPEAFALARITNQLAAGAL